MSRLNSIFEEDIEMQDALGDMEDLTDNSEEIILQAMESRVDPNARKHLFENEVLNDDGLTADEEREYMMSLLDNDSDETLSDEDIDEYLNDTDY